MSSEFNRRSFLKGSLIFGLFSFLGGLFVRKKAEGAVALRPPGAIEEEKFVGKCIRCFLCGEVCPNNAIRFAGFKDGISVMGTPYIVPRDQACILCMKCTEVCPTGALKPVKDDMHEIVANVDMGRAVVDKTTCYSYNNRICGFCYGACPLPDVALSLQNWGRPEITDKCVGCGLCEKICVQTPQAIRVIPRGDKETLAFYENYQIPDIDEHENVYPHDMVMQGKSKLNKDTGAIEVVE